jgi:hypothetical protein
MTAYYNTTHLQGKELTEVIKVTQTQDAKILTFFQEHPTHKLTKYQVYDELLTKGYIHPNTPSTSIGRALNTLVEKGELIKLDEQKEERYGRKNHLFTLNNEKGGN